MVTESSIPQKSDLALLPRWARVAFAVRCARRVQPIIQARGMLPRENVERIERMLSLIEKSCAYGTLASGIQAKLSGRSFPRLSNCLIAAISAAESAQEAARSAGSISEIDTGPAMVQDRAEELARISPIAAAMSAYEAVVHAQPPEVLALAKSSPAAQAVVSAMRHDFELLRAATGRERWTDSTPVPTHFFTALWPEGPPEGWATGPGGNEPTSEGCELIFEVEAPPVASEEEILKKICELAERADSIHRAYGGHGLKNAGVEILGESAVGSPK